MSVPAASVPLSTATTSVAEAAAAAPAPLAAPRKWKVYTKTGDAGTSSLYNMHREPKDHEYFHALGDTDELNAHVGVGCEHCRASSMLPVLTERLVEVQSRLFDIGSAIATPLDTSSEKQLKRARFSADHIVTLEGWIDEMDEELPALKNFILPSGGLCSAELHVARTVCRRAERRTVKLARDGKVAAPVAIWLNRLSDFFFVAARYAALKTGNTETVYKKAREEVLEVDATADADAST